MFLRAAGFAVFILAMAPLSPIDARAALIQGSIGFGGQWIPRDGGGNVSSIPNATQVDIFGNLAIVTAASGDFGGLLFGFANYNDFSFDPFVPATPLWSVPLGLETFSFDLQTVTVNVQSQTMLGLVGTGLLRGVGFDDTPGAFTFSGDGNGGTFTFSNTSTAGATVIPEPQTLGLFGIGLLAIGLLVRRRLDGGARARAASGARLA